MSKPPYLPEGTEAKARDMNILTELGRDTGAGHGHDEAGWSIPPSWVQPQGEGSGIDADTLDGMHLSELDVATLEGHHPREFFIEHYGFLGQYNYSSWNTAPVWVPIDNYIYDPWNMWGPHYTAGGSKAYIYARVSGLYHITLGYGLCGNNGESWGYLYKNGGGQELARWNGGWDPDSWDRYPNWPSAIFYLSAGDYVGCYIYTIDEGGRSHTAYGYVSMFRVDHQPRA